MSTISLGRSVMRGTAPGVGARAWRHSRNALKRAVAALREWRRRSRERAALAAFDDRMLRDIGVTRVDALYEINKPFWRK